MRISTEKSDPGWQRLMEFHAKGQKVAVFLNGLRLDIATIITADDGSGEVVRFARDAKGRVRSDPYQYDRRLTETLHGRVRIEIVHPPMPRG